MKNQNRIDKLLNGDFWMIILNYYDGAVDGLLEVDNSKYTFIMIDDNGIGVRIFALSYMNPLDFEKIIVAFSNFEIPKHPIWIPSIDYNSSEFESKHNLGIMQTLESEHSANIIVAFDTIANRIIAVKDLPVDKKFSLKGMSEFKHTMEIDWFDFLAIKKNQ